MTEEKRGALDNMADRLAERLGVSSRTDLQAVRPDGVEGTRGPPGDYIYGMQDLREPSERVIAALEHPIPMLLHCPICSVRHIDVGIFANKPHHTHACQHCGHVWRPAIVATVGVQFLPGFKNG